LLHVWRLGREARKRENKVELRKLIVALDSFWVIDKLLIDTEKSGLVKNREEGGPFLEEDIDASVREEARGDLG
jgi:hypothetical protein